MSNLRPDFQIHDAGSKVRDIVKSAVLEVTVDERLGEASLCTITLDDTHGQMSDGSKFSIGNELRLELGYVGATTTLFEGEVTGWRGSFPRRGPSRLVVMALDRAHRMRRSRKSRTFLAMKDSDMVSQVASDYGFQVDATPTTIKHDYMLQSNQSDLDFLLERASAIGWECLVEGKKLIFRKPKLDDAPAVTLKWHESLKHFAPVISTAKVPSGVTTTGYDMKQKKMITASAATGDEQSLMGAETAGSGVKDGMQSDPQHMPFSPLLNPAEMDAMAKGVMNREALKFVTGSGACQGNTTIRRGSVIEIDAIGDLLSGKYDVDQARHTLQVGRGYTTTFRVKRTALRKAAPPPLNPPRAAAPPVAATQASDDQTSTVSVTIVLHDVGDQPITATSCTAGEANATSDGGGAVLFNASASFDGSIKVDGFPGDVPVSHDKLQPVATEAGQKARLGNLGFYLAPALSTGAPAGQSTGSSTGQNQGSSQTPSAPMQDPGADPSQDPGAAGPEDNSVELRSAIEEFQCEYGIAVTGECDAATQAKLVEVHGC